MSDCINTAVIQKRLIVLKLTSTAQQPIEISYTIMYFSQFIIILTVVHLTLGRPLIGERIQKIYEGNLAVSDVSSRMSLPLINKSHDEQTTDCVSCRKARTGCLKWEVKNHKLFCAQFKKSKRKLRKTTTKSSTPSTTTVESESSSPVLVPRSE